MSRATDRRHAAKWSWFIPACAATGVLGILLLAMGAEGAVISQALSLVVGVIGCFITIYFQEAKSTPFPFQARGHWILSMAPVIILSLAAGWWFLVHKPDVNVTDLVRISGGTEMRDKAKASVTLPAWNDLSQTSSGRERFALKLRLVNPSQVGNCVGPATLKVTPIVDGREGAPVTVRSDQKAHLSLAGAERRAGAHVTVDLGDPACEVELLVTEAVLYN